MKTNAMRILDTKNIKYVLRDYTETKIVKGTKIASILNENPDQVLKLWFYRENQNNITFV